MTGLRVAAGLVHGMGKELVEPDWPPLTGDEVNAVLTRYGAPAGQGPDAGGTGNAATPRTGTIVAGERGPVGLDQLLAHAVNKPGRGSQPGHGDSPRSAAVTVMPRPGPGRRGAAGTCPS